MRVTLFTFPVFGHSGRRWLLISLAILASMAPNPVRAACLQGDCQNGAGVYQWPSGDRYQGQFKNGQLHGRGQYSQKDGSTYIGEYVSGKRHGHGTLAWASGKKYSGAWNHGLQHGPGQKTWPDGKNQIGLFQNGRFVETKNSKTNQSADTTTSKPAKTVRPIPDLKITPPPVANQSPVHTPEKKTTSTPVAKETHGQPTPHQTVLAPVAIEPPAVAPITSDSGTVKGSRHRPKSANNKGNAEQPAKPNPGKASHPAHPPKSDKKGALPQTSILNADRLQKDLPGHSLAQPQSAGLKVNPPQEKKPEPSAIQTPKANIPAPIVVDKITTAPVVPSQATAPIMPPQKSVVTLEQVARAVPPPKPIIKSKPVEAAKPPVTKPEPIRVDKPEPIPPSKPETVAMAVPSPQLMVKTLAQGGQINRLVENSVVQTVQPGFPEPKPKSRENKPLKPETPGPLADGKTTAPETAANPPATAIVVATVAETPFPRTLDATVPKPKVRETAASIALAHLAQLDTVKPKSRNKTVDTMTLKASKNVTVNPGSAQPDAADSQVKDEENPELKVADNTFRDLSESQPEGSKDVELEFNQLLEEGRMRNEKGQFNRAIYSFTCALAIKPGNAEAHHGRGMALLTLGMPERAIRDFDAALESDPAWYEGLLARGITLRELKEYKTSLRDLSLALISLEAGPEPYMERALTYKEMARYDEALDDLNQALSKEPKLERAYYIKGLVMAKNGKPAEAVENFNTAIAQNPDQAQYYFERANAISASGQISQAIDDYDKAIALMGHDAEYYFARGSAHQSLNNVALMCQDLKSACDMGDVAGCDDAQKKCPSVVPVVPNPVVAKSKNPAIP